MMSPRQLIEHMADKSLNCRTAILWIAPGRIGTESQIAASLGVQHVDYREYLLQHAPADSQFLNLTLGRIVSQLDDIASASTGMDRALVSNFDLAAARLGSQQRASLWRTLFSDFSHRTKALIFSLPLHEDGQYIFSDLAVGRMWKDSERCSIWP